MCCSSAQFRLLRPSSSLVVDICSSDGHSYGWRIRGHDNVFEVFIQARVVAVVVRAKLIEISRLFRKWRRFSNIHKALLDELSVWLL